MRRVSAASFEGLFNPSCATGTTLAGGLSPCRPDAETGAGAIVGPARRSGGRVSVGR